jgi:hypothetical protein
MKLISPTRVSIYDFTYTDTLPLTPLLADISHLSLPQAQRGLTASLQALLSALLSYQARHGGTAVLKKLFSRSGIKDLRQYNSMNFVTLSIALNYRQAVADALFPDSRTLSAAVDYIAADIQAAPEHVYTLLTTLSVIFLRELAILADYAQLDSEDVGDWLQLQPQFLAPARFNPTNNDPASQFATIAQQNAAWENHDNKTNRDTSEELDAVTSLQDNHPVTSNASDNKDDNEPNPLLNPKIAQDLAAMDAIVAPPPFDPYWYEITRYSPAPIVLTEGNDDAVPHYAKIIGRSIDNADQSLHDDLLAFGPMGAVSLPHQRWLLQLAKISDIYLSRQRLKIASEPKSPPSRPFVSLSMLGASPTIATPTIDKPGTAPLAPAKAKPLWKDPVILIICLVIGVLGGLAMLKYQSKQADKAQNKVTVSKTKASDTASKPNAADPSAEGKAPVAK